MAKTMTEQELKDLGRVPRKVRMNLLDGRKQVHIFTDAEILELVKTGKATIGKDAEWIDIVKE